MDFVSPEPQICTSAPVLETDPLTIEGSFISAKPLLDIAVSVIADGLPENPAAA